MKIIPPIVGVLFLSLCVSFKYLFICWFNFNFFKIGIKIDPKSNEIKKEIDIDLYYFYPKIKDFIDLETILLDSEKFRLTKEVLQLEKKENVWEIVEDWWNLTFKILLK